MIFLTFQDNEFYTQVIYKKVYYNEGTNILAKRVLPKFLCLNFFPNKICLTIVSTLLTAVFRTSDLVLKLVFTVFDSLQNSLCWYNPFIKKCITITELVVTFFKKFRISPSPCNDKTSRSSQRNFVQKLSWHLRIQ